MMNILGTAVLAICLITTFYKIEDPLRFEGDQNTLNELFAKRPNLRNLVYRPSLSHLEGHVNSLMSGTLTFYHQRFTRRILYQRGVFKLSDGGEILLDYNKGNKLGLSRDDIIPTRPLIILVPGYFSGINDHYHHTLIDEANMHGYDWVIINYRGLEHPTVNGKPFSANDLIGFKEPTEYIAKLS